MSQIKRKKNPRCLIIGRPNVGKSTLINRIIKKRQSITFDQPGVTRDIVVTPVLWKGASFDLVDSGGIFFSDKQDASFQSRLEALVERELKTATVILFLTDAKVGVHPYDQLIARRLLPYQDRVVVVANKVDHTRMMTHVHEFSALGFGAPFGVSAVHGVGVNQMLSSVVSRFWPNKQTREMEMPEMGQDGAGSTEDSAQGDDSHEDESHGPYKVAFMGRPNVGKSSLLNAILNQERVLVDAQSGTTRDAIEVPFWYQKTPFVLVDTAGLRKKGKMSDALEFYASVRSSEALRKSDLVVMVLEPDPFLADQDKKVLQLIMDAGKPIVVFVNKWDSLGVEGLEREDIRSKMMAYIAQEMPALVHYPFLFGSAKTSHNVYRLLDRIPDIVQSARVRVETGKFNRFISRVLKRNQPPAKRGAVLKLYYGTQTNVSPRRRLYFL